MTAQSWLRQQRPSLAVTGLSLVLGLLGLALLATTTGNGSPGGQASITFAVVVGVLYVIAESTQFHLEVRRQALSVSISDLPLVLGLFLLPPWWLLGVRLAASLLVFSARRMAPVKAMFNLGLFTGEIGAAVALFHLLDVGDGRSPADWAATYLTVIVLDVAGSLAVILAMRFLQGPPTRAAMVEMVTSVVVSGVLTTTLALMGVVDLRTTPYGMVLLAIMIAILSVAHRAYFSLLRRHTDLGQLFAFTQTVGAVETTDDMVGAVLRQARELLQAESAVLRLPPEDDGKHRLPGGEALVIERNTKDPLLRHWLAQADLRDALLVPLRDGREVIGVLQVGNRLGAVSTFTRDDLRLLQTLAAHAEVIWRNGRLLEKLRYDAHHDALTGLGNRNRFRQRLAALLNEVPATSSRPARPTRTRPEGDTCDAAVLLLDLDRFKEVNDALSHPVGDALLQKVADRLTGHLPADAVVARLGGDEFAALLPGCRSIEAAMREAASARAALDDPFEVQGTFLDIGASVGVAVIPQDGRDADSVLQHADVAMYTAKHTTQGIARYRPADDNNSRQRLALAGDLRRGMEADQIEMYYQPKVSADTGQLIGFEALARWNHPERGLVPPDQFISLAEQTGLIGRLTEIALTQSLTQAGTWLTGSPDRGIAVNLSPRRLLDPDLPTLVARLLADTGVPANLLTLEITESSLMTDPDASTRALHELREIGIRLSVDDFGTGYSALAYLQRLPLDEVKIDKSFVIPMTTDPGARAIVRAIVELAHTLDLGVVAEGVEHEPSREALRGMGCDVMQGYLISRPLRRGQMAAWIADWQNRNPVARVDPARVRRS